MEGLFHWYLIGVIACVPFMFYDMGIYLTNESYSKVGGTRGARVFALVFYLIVCLGSWFVFVLETFAFVCDVVFGIKRYGRTGNEQ